MRVVFMGTPDFAVPCLDALLAAGHDVVRVISQPDRPKGRGQELASPPVVVRARALGLDVRQPRGVNGGGFAEALRALDADVAAVVAYGRILPRSVLEAPRFGCVNVHASLLPRWRGSAPIQRAVMAGDAVSGVSTQRMEEGLDTGPVYLSRALTLDPRETSATLHDRLSALGAALLVDTLAAIAAGAEPVPQDPAAATHAAMLSKDDGRIRWDEPAEASDRRIRGVTPWPGGWVDTRRGPLKVLEARPVPGDGAPGVVVSLNPLRVGTSDGLLELVTVQAAGKRPTDGASYVNGARLAVGDPL
jgi:methionyl-tRNA formyltransferase